MHMLEFMSLSQPKREEFVNFIVFEPASQRILPQDVFLRGEAVLDHFERVMMAVGTGNSLKEQTIYNRLSRLQMMLDLVKQPEGLVMTKFLSKVWRRYSFFSNLGEVFMDFSAFTTLLDDYDMDDDKLVLARLLDDGEDMDMDSEDEDSDDEDDENEDEAQSEDASKTKKASGSEKAAKKPAAKKAAAKPKKASK